MSPADFGPFCIGEEVRIPLDVRTAEGVLADTGWVILRVKAPNGTIQIFESPDGGGVRDGVGRYHADVLLTAAGRWWFRWETDSPLKGAREDSLTVLASKVL